MYYGYTINTDADRSKYHECKQKLSEIPDIEFAGEEFDNEDESLFQFFNVNGERQFLLKCDEWVGAVYIESKIRLEKYYDFKWPVIEMYDDLTW